MMFALMVSQLEFGAKHDFLINLFLIKIPQYRCGQDAVTVLFTCSRRKSIKCGHEYDLLKYEPRQKIKMKITSPLQRPMFWLAGQ